MSVYKSLSSNAFFPLVKLKNVLRYMSVHLKILLIFIIFKSQFYYFEIELRLLIFSFFYYAQIQIINKFIKFL